MLKDSKIPLLEMITGRERNEKFKFQNSKFKLSIPLIPAIDEVVKERCFRPCVGTRCLPIIWPQYKARE